MQTINFLDFAPEATCLVGKELGIQIRSQVNLNLDESLCLVFPHQIVTVSKSFWQGFWGNDLNRFTKTSFYNQVEIVGTEHLSNKVASFFGSTT